jgi:hypothetical protein
MTGGEKKKKKSTFLTPGPFMQRLVVLNIYMNSFDDMKKRGGKVKAMREVIKVLWKEECTS